MRLSSPAFRDGGAIPARHSARDADLSPALTFHEVPAEAKELALVCRDFDAPGGWTHWLVYGLLPRNPGLPEGLPRRQFAAGGAQGVNSWGALGWGGPLPPPGPAHRYIFTLYALDRRLGLPSGERIERVKAVLTGLMIAEAGLIGTYRR